MVEKQKGNWLCPLWCSLPKNIINPFQGWCSHGLITFHQASVPKRSATSLPPHWGSHLQHTNLCGTHQNLIANHRTGQQNVWSYQVFTGKGQEAIGQGWGQCRPRNAQSGENGKSWLGKYMKAILYSEVLTARWGRCSDGEAPILTHFLKVLSFDFN
jgi:hypothetical protein